MTVAECAPEPEIITQNREQLAYLLTEAAEIEHGLMCCYLYAAYSLKRGAADGLSPEDAALVARWRGAIVGVAVEEMVHLSLVSNLLTAIGFAPQFERPNFPVAPGYHPSGIVVSLAPFELATLDHFLFLERPEGVDIPDGAGFDAPPPVERATRSDRLMPSSEDYATVGHLYRGIRAGFAGLAATLATALFAGDPAAQVGPESAALPGLTAVTDLASALRAIDTVVEQGEGTQADSARSHYRRFLAVRDEYRTLKGSRPEFEPALPVARNPVMRRPPDARRKVHVDEPKAARLMDSATPSTVTPYECSRARSVVRTIRGPQGESLVPIAEPSDARRVDRIAFFHALNLSIAFKKVPAARIDPAVVVDADSRPSSKPLRAARDRMAARRAHDVDSLTRPARGLPPRKATRSKSCRAARPRTEAYRL